MFNFFDNQKNPFMGMMNMMSTENMKDTEDKEAQEDRKEVSADAESAQMPVAQQLFMSQMQLMQETCMMQMQLMQALWMMPLQFTQGVFKMMEKGAGLSGASEGQESGFKLGKLEIPPEMIGRLMQMDMSPENLEKLQRVLDFLFNSAPQSDEQQGADTK